MLLGLNGLRCGELIACNVEDLGNHSWHHTLKLTTTKGGRPTVVALAPPTMQAVALVVAGRDRGPLLDDQAGRRMTAYNIQYLVAALARDAAIPVHLTPTGYVTRRSPSGWTRACRCATCRTSPATPIRNHPALRPVPARAEPPRHLRHRPLPRRQELNNPLPPRSCEPRTAVWGTVLWMTAPEPCSRMRGSSNQWSTSCTWRGFGCQPIAWCCRTMAGSVSARR